MGLMAGLKEGARFSPYTQYESRVDCLGTFVQIRYVINSIGLTCSKSLHQDPEEIRNNTDPSAVATPYSERFGFQMNFEALQRHDSY